MGDMEYKRIGWIVEWRGNTKWKWNNSSSGFSSFTKTDAIWKFNAWCKFNIIPKRVIEKFRWLKRRGLARCVPVYVEALDAT